MDRARLRSLFDMEGRAVIVTGGTRGIGRALAEGYAAAGARVVVLLSSDAGSFITGPVLFADGGMVPR